MASPTSMPPQSSRSTSISDSADYLNTTSFWGEEQEARLQHCQVELEKAQKRWSSSQDLWIEEVEHLLELKKAYLKAVKKQINQAKKGGGKRTKRPWNALSRTSSKVDATLVAPEDDADDEDDQDDGSDDEEGDSLDRLKRTDSMQELPPPSPQSAPNRRSSLGKVIRRLSIPVGRGRRKASTAGSGPSASQSENATPATPTIPNEIIR